MKFKIYGLTSSEDKDTVKKYTDFGVQDVIFKPLKAEDVKKILNNETCFKKNLERNNNLTNANIGSNGNNLKEGSNRINNLKNNSLLSNISNKNG